MTTFAQGFWNKFSLLNLYTAHEADISTPREKSQKALKDYDFFLPSISKLNRADSKNIEYISRYVEVELYEGNVWEDKFSDSVILNFHPSDAIRFTWRHENASNRYDDWLVFGVGTLAKFNEIKATAIEALNKGTFTHKGKRYDEVKIFYGNEALLMGKSGFRSRSRGELSKMNASDRAAFIEFDSEDFFEGDDNYIDKEILNRSFSVRQSASIKNWIGDGLHILETNEVGEYNGMDEYTNAKAFVLSINGVFLGEYEEEIDDPSSKELGIVESGIRSFKNSKVPKTITDLFKTETQEFKRAAGAPIFVGFRKTQLGFDWLTGMPTQASKGDKNSKKIVSLIGSDAPLLQNDQVYLALEDCDIVTGKGRDLVILADDIRNKDVNSVPRIHDFNPKQDKVLIPVEVFRGFNANTSGTIGKTAFHQGKKATNKNQRLIYNRSLGYLYHDPDGSGKATQQLIAAFTSKPSIEFNNIILG